MKPSFCQVNNPALSMCGMCRCEVDLHVQKRKELEEGDAYLHILNELAGVCDEFGRIVSTQIVI